MGNDRLRRIERVHQLPDHPIRIDRRFLGAEAGHPLALGRLPELLDVSSHTVGGPSCSPLAASLVKQLPQDEARIADHRLVNGIVAVDIPAVDSHLDQGFARGNRRGEAATRKTTADAEHEVRFDQEMRCRSGNRVATRTE